MKILHIDQHYNYGGGTEQYLLSIMDLLEKRGHPQVIVYAIKTDKTVTKEGRREYCLPGITAEFNRDKLGELEKIINHESPDIIYLHNVHNMFAVELCVKKRPTIRYIHDPSICCFTHWKLLPGLIDLCEDRLGLSCFRNRCLKFEPKNFTSYQVKKRNLRLHNNLNKIIVASEYMKHLLVQNGVSSSKIEIISYFVTSPPSDFLLKPANIDDAKTILYAGLIHKIKGVDLMLKALSLVKNDFIAVLAGSGEYLEEYKQMAIDLGIGERVKFLGWVPNEILMEHYRNAALMLVPSFWIEAFAIVGIEAMSCAKPVIGFDTGGISEWLKHNINGFLVPRGAYDEMAKKIDILLESKKQREEMGQAGRNLYEANFTKEIHTGKLLDVFEKISS